MDQTELVAREAELDRLRAAFDSCLTGFGHVATLTGPVGAGRTRLIDSLARYATGQGALHLRAEGSPAEADLPFALLLQLFQQAPLGRDTSGEVCRLVSAGISTVSKADGEARLPMAVLHGLVGVLLDVAERTPMLVTVDDCQYADPQSLQCLHYLIRRTRTSRALVVLGRRDGFSPAHPTADSDLLRLPHHEQIKLPLLTRTEVGFLLDELLREGEGRPPSAAVHAVTGGNPLLVTALAEDHRASRRASDIGPPRPAAPGEAFRRDLLSCLYRLPALTLPVAQALAVLGGAVGPEALSRVLDVPAERIAPVLTGLDAAGLTRDGDFRHPRARGFVLATMTVEEQAALRGDSAPGRHRGESPAGASATIGAPSARARIRSLPGLDTREEERTALSEAELRVAELAAEGLTNREIAARLFITVSTVEQHLTRVYRKLVVTRRVDLAESLRRSAACPAA
ncbi:AAA family ATPase [Streptomyces sp. NPDC049040]|uniref:helix-turn-helix transcriptional regulator n=1 Tax=Streptomyces sp. NPDC049040 TaxID=3365593 RepID=UPI00371D9CFF